MARPTTSVRTAVLALAFLTATAFSLVPTPFASAPPAGAALAQPTTAAYLWFSPAGGEESTTDVTVVEATPTFLHIQYAAPLTGYVTDTYFTPPAGEQLAVGTYADATYWFTQQAGHPGIGIVKGAIGICFTGRFEVDGITFDGSQHLTSLALRFQANCTNNAWFGAISYASTADYRTLTHTSALTFPDTATGTSSPAASLTVANNGPSELSFTSATITGLNASQFLISANTCPGSIPAGASCHLDVAFAPTGAPGFRSASLELVDDLSPAGGPARTFPLSAVAYVAPPPPDPTGEYTALTPARILDTRGDPAVSCNTSLAKVGAGATVDVQVGGCGGIPASGVAAVVLNATVTDPTASSYLTVFPKGIARPTISNLNYVATQTVPNAVTVKLGTGGEVSVYNNAGQAHVIFDVVGYYAASDGPLGLRYHGSNQTRMVDTRPVNYPILAGQPLVRPVNVYHAEDGSFVNGVKAVALNVTVTEPTAPGHLTIYPDDVGKPLASSLNFTPGLTVANLVIVRVPADGKIVFENSAGTLHLVVDVLGWYDADKTTEEGRFIPYPPYRRFDTREFVPPDPLGPQEILVAPMSPAPGLPNTSVAATAMNVTVTQTSAPGYLAAYPDNPLGPGFPMVGPPPGTSTLNYQPGRDVANATITRIGSSGRIGFYNPFGSTHLVVDVFGYFTGRGLAPAAASAAGDGIVRAPNGAT